MIVRVAGWRPAMAGWRPAMAGRRPERYRGDGRRLMLLRPVRPIGRAPPAPVAAITGGGAGVEGPGYRSSWRQAAIRCGGNGVAQPLLLNFRRNRPVWREIQDSTKLKPPLAGRGPETEGGCCKEPQSHDHQGEPDAPHPGHVGRADLPPLDLVVHDEGTLSGAWPCSVWPSREKPDLARQEVKLAWHQVSDGVARRAA